MLTSLNSHALLVPGDHGRALGSRSASRLREGPRIRSKSLNRDQPYRPPWGSGSSTSRLVKDLGADVVDYTKQAFETVLHDYVRRLGHPRRRNPGEVAASAQARQEAHQRR